MDLGSKVLVATDLSDAADEAIRQGYDRARLSGGELAVCHIVPDVLRDSPLFPQTASEDTARQLDLTKQAAAAVEARVAVVTGAKPGTGPSSYRVIVESGTPETAIVRIAEESCATLVVVSSRGLTGLDRVLLGSVAARVVRYAHGPVLVARPHTTTGRMLAATDFSDPAVPAVAVAVEEARALGAKLTLLHAVDLLPRPVMAWGTPFGASLVVPPKELVENVKASVEEALRADLARFGFGAQGDVRAAVGDATTSILAAARDLDAQLVVVATRGRTGLRRMVLGSVAERIIEQSPCSVLAVRHTASSQP
jgi:nucleotide-binding universal stress UspA family protein